MATVFDVAAYILQKKNSVTAMKLQKLVYYAQAWSLVWDEKPLFKEEIQAWANGPVVPDLYKLHAGKFMLSASDVPGDSAKLTKDECETVDAVLGFYGDKTAQWLSDLTHAETPWKQARQGLSDAERGTKEITTASMAEYYSGIPSDVVSLLWLRNPSVLVRELLSKNRRKARE
jgi:uncharacterized phage-associated protein